MKEVIVKPLTHIFNFSVLQGVVPSYMKIAKIIPIYKSGKHDNFNNQ
jgi:hypothetical protein